jgi:DnaJ-class molecular chaperone
MDPFSTLEVPYTATDDVIKKAYRRLAKLWHPDTNSGSKDAEEKFKSIQAAYDCLVDPIKRADEDATRRRREQADAARKAKAEADKQARTRAYSQSPPSWRLNIKPWAMVVAFITLVLIVAALFGANNGGTERPTA